MPGLVAAVSGVELERVVQALPRYICRNGFELLVANKPSHAASVLGEASTRRLDWDAFSHDGRGRAAAEV